MIREINWEINNTGREDWILFGRSSLSDNKLFNRTLYGRGNNKTLEWRGNVLK